MIETTKLKETFPNCELSEIRPCTTPGRIQFHLLIDKDKDVRQRIIDTLCLKNLMLDANEFKKISESTTLGVVKATYGGAEISVMGSGRIVVRGASDEPLAKEILEKLAPLIKKSLQ